MNKELAVTDTPARDEEAVVCLVSDRDLDIDPALGELAPQDVGVEHRVDVEVAKH